MIPTRYNEPVDKSHKGRHFQIWFDIPTKRYYIKDLGIGFGVFKKMEFGKTVLKDNMLINIGEAYIVVNLYPLGADQQGQSYTTLKLKMFGGPNNGEIYDFGLEEIQNRKRDILIGRTPECDVKITDKLLSKIQCHISLCPDEFN